MNNRVYAIAAMDQSRVIGKQNKIPWHLPQDMQRFKQLTMGHTVVMGRRTFDSLPDKFKPLPGRHNVVVSRTLKEIERFPQVEMCADLGRYLERFKRGVESKTAWIIGGAEIYAQSVAFWDGLYLTLIKQSHDGDAYFPLFEQDFSLVESEDFPGYSFLHYQRKA